MHDGVADFVGAAGRRTGTIVCHGQRYDPTPAELAATPAIPGQVIERLDKPFVTCEADG